MTGEPRKYRDFEDNEAKLPKTGIRWCISHKNKHVTENGLSKKRARQRKRQQEQARQ